MPKSVYIVMLDNELNDTYNEIIKLFETKEAANLFQQELTAYEATSPPRLKKVWASRDEYVQAVNLWYDHHPAGERRSGEFYVREFEVH